jgi:DNA-binding NarL/FixJ family response regulator
MQHAVTSYVLDDDPAVNEVICGILSRSGVHFRSFLRFSELLEGLADRHPDLLFLDVRLDDADAVEAIRHLHAIGYQGKIQVVSGLSAAQLTEVYRMLERYGYGALYPIAKPFRSAAIKAALAHATTPTASTIVQDTGSRESALAGWMTSSVGGAGVLIIQPHLVGSANQPDLLATPALFDATVHQGLDACLAQQDSGDRHIWVHMTTDAAMALPRTSLVGAPATQNALQLSIIVAAQQMATAPSQIDDLRTRLAVYGYGVGCYVDSLADFSLGGLVRIAGGRLVLGSNCVAQILGSATGRILGENLLIACRNKAISVAACHNADQTDMSALIEMGIEWLVTPPEQMSPLEHLALQSMPQFPRPEGRKLAATVPPPDFPGHNLLSQREYEIVKLTVTGLSAKEAGRALDLSHRTVEVHRSNIFAKLGVKNVAQLTRLVLGA